MAYCETRVMPPHATNYCDTGPHLPQPQKLRQHGPLPGLAVLLVLHASTGFLSRLLWQADRGATDCSLWTLRPNPCGCLTLDPFLVNACTVALFSPWTLRLLGPLAPELTRVRKSIRTCETYVIPCGCLTLLDAWTFVPFPPWTLGLFGPLAPEPMRVRKSTLTS